jgi:hypothetical protein
MQMREIMKLLEASGNEGETAAPTPATLYHGTGPATAAMIVKSGVLRATEPVDDDGHGPTVSATSSEKVGHDFACEYARMASPYDVGFIFRINGTLVGETCEVLAEYEAETASSDEEEYRIKSDLPLKRYVTGLRPTGDIEQLRDSRFRRQMYDEACDDVYDFRRAFPTFASFSSVLTKMCRANW